MIFRPTPLGAPGLKLHAIDPEDLLLFSALLQDALVRVGDLAFLPGSRRFAFIGSRFDWATEALGKCERACSGVHFDGVMAARYLNIARERPDAILELLAIGFEPGEEPPEGRVRLSFAGGGAILLEVECVEARLRDLGPRWSVSGCPSHDLDEGGATGS